MMKRAALVDNLHQTSCQFAWKPNAGFEEQNKESTASGRLSDPLDNSDEEEEPEFQIGIPAYRPIFGRHSRPLRRFCWIVLSLIFLAVAVVQVEDRISYYLKTPLETFSISVNNDTLTFPRVTLCNRNIVNPNLITPELKSAAAKKLGVNESEITKPGDLLSVMNVSTLWTMMANNLTAQNEFECWFGRNKLCNESGRWSVVHTARGPCFSFELDAPVSESGIYNGLYLQMEGRIVENENNQSNVDSSSILDWSGNVSDSWVIVTHHPSVNPAIVVMDKHNFMKPGWNVDVQVRIFQYEYLNVWHSPCIDDLAYSLELCQIYCFSEMFVENFTCLLPFMQLSPNSPLNNIYGMCNTSESYNKAIKAHTAIFQSDLWNPSSCMQCMYPCYITIFENNYEKYLGEDESNRLRLRIFYPDKMWSMGHQHLIYDLITLFCDIGNSVGLLLGASLLTLVEMLEWAVISFFRCLVSLTGQTTKSRIGPVSSN